jgi:catechol 2,3-dioxygenase-like lactoylglutathione lyase family enzyme
MYLTTGNPANVGRLAHYSFGLPTYWAQRDELGAELVRRGFEGVRPDGQAGWFVNGPSGWVQHICVVKDYAMFPGAATPCAEYPSAACTAAHEKGLENLDEIPGPSGTGFTALYFKYIILNVPDVVKELKFYTSLMGMGILAHRGFDMDHDDDVWLRFGQNTLVLRQTVGAPFSNEFGFVIEDYDPEEVKAELDRRGIPSQLNAFGGYDLFDPNGLKISINGTLGGHQ